MINEQMKKILLMALLIVGATAAGYAQCDKKLIFSSSKTEHFEKGLIDRTDAENTTLQILSSTIKLIINGEEKGEFSITSKTCNWTVPFKEGESTFKATREDETFTFEIVGREGKIYLTATQAGDVDHPIRLSGDKFEELK